ncbi:cardiolipin synthase [Microvirga pudoricolor]|uniref:cardiolipin synthase n=1 Tax=Microvirga pudoricolor TaxID=2778729 RepID=UPI00195250CF|nr:cardiolipin synthase [Microvirga pudoricolor]MBM6592459.1 cardiolipin synthase [Microvirga pudoricolor]
MEALSWGLVYFLSEWVIRIVMVVVIPFRRSPDAARGWLLLVLFLPWPALILYLMIGRPDYPRWRHERFGQLAKVFPGIMGKAAEPRAQAVAPLPDHLQPVALLSRNLGHFPVVDGNSLEYLPDYDTVIDRLVADIDAAEREVHLLFYIFASDEAGRKVTDALARAVARGLDTRVLIDAQGSRPWAKATLAGLEAAGVSVHRMLPVRFRPGHRIRADLRNHRKIAIIDGRYGYVGSQNIVDRDFKPGIVNQELMVRLQGPIVQQLQATFLADWFLETTQALSTDDFEREVDREGNAVLQILPSGPDYVGTGIEHLVVALVHNARERIIVVTPYFVPDGALLNAMKIAVLRGVEVHLVVSKIADQTLVRLAQRSYYAELLRAGVRIHLFKNKLLHAKNMSVDGRIGLVGSSNFDIRSFVLNSEISLLVYDEASAARLVTIQEGYLRDSESLTFEEWRRRPFAIRIVENLGRMLSPLL